MRVLSTHLVHQPTGSWAWVKNKLFSCRHKELTRFKMFRRYHADPTIVWLSLLTLFKVSASSHLPINQMTNKMKTRRKKVRNLRRSMLCTLGVVDWVVSWVTETSITITIQKSFKPSTPSSKSLVALITLVLSVQMTT